MLSALSPKLSAASQCLLRWTLSYCGQLPQVHLDCLHFTGFLACFAVWTCVDLLCRCWCVHHEEDHSYCSSKSFLLNFDHTEKLILVCCVYTCVQFMRCLNNMRTMFLSNSFHFASINRQEQHVKLQPQCAEQPDYTKPCLLEICWKSQVRDTSL